LTGLLLSAMANDEKSYLQRGQHNIDDELIFTNHEGYIFHDSRGFESGSEDELKTVQEFVKRKSQAKRLKDRLHVIWFVLLRIHGCKITMSRLLFRYCIPMDNNRPSLDLKYFEEICPDKNGMFMSKWDCMDRD
jgi:hypothetical protein